MAAGGHGGGEGDVGDIGTEMENLNFILTEGGKDSDTLIDEINEWYKGEAECVSSKEVRAQVVIRMILDLDQESMIGRQSLPHLYQLLEENAKGFFKYDEGNWEQVVQKLFVDATSKVEGDEIAADAFLKCMEMKAVMGGDDGFMMVQNWVQTCKKRRTRDPRERNIAIPVLFSLIVLQDEKQGKLRRNLFHRKESPFLTWIIDWIREGEGLSDKARGSGGGGGGEGGEEGDKPRDSEWQTSLRPKVLTILSRITRFPKNIAIRVQNTLIPEKVADDEVDDDILHWLWGLVLESDRKGSKKEEITGETEREGALRTLAGLCSRIPWNQSEERLRTLRRVVMQVNVDDDPISFHRIHPNDLIAIVKRGGVCREIAALVSFFHSLLDMSRKVAREKREESLEPLSEWRDVLCREGDVVRFAVDAVRVSLSSFDIEEHFRVKLSTDGHKSHIEHAKRCLEAFEVKKTEEEEEKGEYLYVHPSPQYFIVRDGMALLQQFLGTEGGAGQARRALVAALVGENLSKLIIEALKQRVPWASRLAAAAFLDPATSLPSKREEIERELVSFLNFFEGKRGVARTPEMIVEVVETLTALQLGDDIIASHILTALGLHTTRRSRRGRRAEYDAMVSVELLERAVAEKDASLAPRERKELHKRGHRAVAKYLSLAQHGLSVSDCSELAEKVLREVKEVHLKEMREGGGGEEGEGGGEELKVEDLDDVSFDSCLFLSELFLNIKDRFPHHLLPPPMDTSEIELWKIPPKHIRYSQTCGVSVGKKREEGGEELEELTPKIFLEFLQKEEDEIDMPPLESLRKRRVDAEELFRDKYDKRGRVRVIGFGDAPKVVLKVRSCVCKREHVEAVVGRLQAEVATAKELKHHPSVCHVVGDRVTVEGVELPRFGRMHNVSLFASLSPRVNCSLEAWLRNIRAFHPTPPRYFGALCDVAIQMTRALARLREQRILHLDMKPDNVGVILGSTDLLDIHQIVILDFEHAACIKREEESDRPSAHTSTSSSSSSSSSASRMEDRANEILRELDAPLLANPKAIFDKRRDRHMGNGMFASPEIHWMHEYAKKCAGGGDPVLPLFDVSKQGVFELGLMLGLLFFPALTDYLPSGFHPSKPRHPWTRKEIQEACNAFSSIPFFPLLPTTLISYMLEYNASERPTMLEALILLEHWYKSVRHSPTAPSSSPKRTKVG